MFRNERAPLPFLGEEGVAVSIPWFRHGIAVSIPWIHLIAQEEEDEEEEEHLPLPTASLYYCLVL